MPQISTPEPTRWRRLPIGPHRLRYGSAGIGRAVVIPRKDQGAYSAAEVLARSYRVIQVEPLGFGGSDRPEQPPIGVADQILAVCDAEDVDDFAIWGYSQGGLMACAVTRATPRVRALVCGGYNVLRPPSPAWIARMNRERRIAPGSRAFWNEVDGVDWHHELRQWRLPVLVYAGTRDHQRVIRPADRHLLTTLRGRARRPRRW